MKRRAKRSLQRFKDCGKAGIWICLCQLQVTGLSVIPCSPGRQAEHVSQCWWDSRGLSGGKTLLPVSEYCGTWWVEGRRGQTHHSFREESGEKAKEIRSYLEGVFSGPLGWAGAGKFFGDWLGTLMEGLLSPYTQYGPSCSLESLNVGKKVLLWNPVSAGREGGDTDVGEGTVVGWGIDVGRENWWWKGKLMVEEEVNDGRGNWWWERKLMIGRGHWLQEGKIDGQKLMIGRAKSWDGEFDAGKNISTCLNLPNSFHVNQQFFVVGFGPRPTCQCSSLHAGESCQLGIQDGSG